MVTLKAKCIKEFDSDGLKLELDKTYDIAKATHDGDLIVFTKDGWFVVSEYQEHLVIC